MLQLYDDWNCLCPKSFILFEAQNRLLSYSVSLLRRWSYIAFRNTVKKFPNIHLGQSLSSRKYCTSTMKNEPFRLNHGGMIFGSSIHQKYNHNCGKPLNRYIIWLQQCLYLSQRDTVGQNYPMGMQFFLFNVNSWAQCWSASFCHWEVKNLTNFCFELLFFRNW